MTEPALSAAQRDAFDRDGYTVLPGLIPPDLLARLRTSFDRMLIADDPADKVILPTGNGAVVVNLDRLCARDDLSVLELAGLPAILCLAQELCGDDFFPIQEFAVIKHRGDRNPVLWHQDMVHGRSGTCFTLGIYLDDATPGDGALQVVPGSHRDPRDICALMQGARRDVPMRAGDGLLHDMMLAHGSEPLSERPIRRVIYFEFLSAAQVARERIYSAEVARSRQRLLHAATRLRAERNPGECRFELPFANPAQDDAAGTVAEIVAEIYAAPVRARCSSYCVNGTAVFAAID